MPAIASIEDLRAAQKDLQEANDLNELKVALEVADLKSQIATSSGSPNRSQFVTGSTHGGRRKLPMVFTEHGAIMAANVLRSKQAIQMNIVEHPQMRSVQ